MSSTKLQQRKRRQNRIRAKVQGTATRPRLAVYRSLNNIYAQLIDDKTGKVVASASTLKGKKAVKTDQAKEVGKAIATEAKKKKITQCVFDRGGNLFHGRIKAVADAAREAGLEF